MSQLIVIFKALFLGFATGILLSIPLGPAGIESVKRTVSKGYKQGLIVSLGAISADFTYLFIINAGLSSLLAANKRTESLFWIISGIILSIIGYISIKSHRAASNDMKHIKTSKLSSMPFLAGFIITFSNPMTPSLWLTLSGTVIRAWYYVSLTAYYIFIFSIILGMVAWFSLLNYLALKGTKVLKPGHFNATSKLLNYSIVVIGLGFVIFGFFNLFNII
ncbi:translocator protein, LysE family [Clostridiales bacterium oral taxon 876 str. F0540]|nr:translocator protein, LysE family [Clostridiales bacterium oral taxon 876 str. F0540]